jgi:hypothetical protein
MKKNILKGFETSTIKLLPVEINDVPDLYKLRITRKNNYLNQIDSSIKVQYQYFENYQKRLLFEEEVYLKIIFKKTDEVCGYVRLTELLSSLSLGWESLILKTGIPGKVGIEVCFSIYYLSFIYLQRSILGPWIVNDNNFHMMKIHSYMGLVTEVDKTDKGKVLIITRNNFLTGKDKFLKWGFANEFKAN